MECIASSLACISSTVCSSLEKNPSLPLPPSKRTPLNRRTPKPKQPSVSEVEKAIGAGIFRDYNPSSSGGGGKPTFFDLLSSSPVGKPEGSTEKKLRETGEWILERTEGASRSGQEVLMVVCLKILPFWLFFLLVASGVIKLPFNIPVLDNLLM